MNHEDIEDQIKVAYSTTAAVYRKDDELDATGKDHQRLCEILAMLSSSFGRPITVLDARCGTGRYFHCLKSTRKLVGLDVSPEMLQEARHPVKKEDVSVTEIEFVCGSVYTQSFPDKSFDLIYSIGVFGNGCGLTKELLSKFHGWLAPDGCVFFDVIDSFGLPRALRARLWLRKMFHEICPGPLRRLFGKRRNESLPPHIYSRGQIHKSPPILWVLRGSRLSAGRPDALGQGRKLHVLGLSRTRAKHIAAVRLPESKKGKKA